MAYKHYRPKSLFIITDDYLRKYTHFPGIIKS